MLQSFKHSVEGIIYCLQTQRNMRIHFFAALMVLLGSIFLQLSKYDIMILLLVIAMVVICEMINTAIEKTVDMYTDKFHPLARISKDVAAGAVLVSAIVSVLIGYLLFIDKAVNYTDTVIQSIKENEMHIAFISILGVLAIVVAFKYIYNSQKLVQGGMPSGHSAVAASIVTAIFMLSSNVIVCILSAVLGILIIESRIETGVHSFIEVLVGSILGTCLTYLLFKLLA